MSIIRNESLAGTIVQFKLSAGAVHRLTEPMRFDGSVVASEVIIIGEEGAVISLPLASKRRRRMSTRSGTVRAALILSTQQKVQLQGIVFQGGAASFGVAAVVIESGELEMRNCTVRGVQGTRALHASGGKSIIQSSRFEANLGGAIEASSGSNVLIRDSFLVKNTAANGGALAVTGNLTEVTAIATRIERNSAEVRGGGLHVAAGSVILAHGTLLEQNEAPEGKGKAMHLSGGTILFALPAGPGRWVNTAFDMEVARVQPGLRTLVTKHVESPTTAQCEGWLCLLLWLWATIHDAHSRVNNPETLRAILLCLCPTRSARWLSDHRTRTTRLHARRASAAHMVMPTRLRHRSALSALALARRGRCAR